MTYHIEKPIITSSKDGMFILKCHREYAKTTELMQQTHLSELFTMNLIFSFSVCSMLVDIGLDRGLCSLSGLPLSVCQEDYTKSTKRLVDRWTLGLIRTY